MLRTLHYSNGIYLGLGKYSSIDKYQLEKGGFLVVDAVIKRASIVGLIPDIKDLQQQIETKLFRQGADGLGQVWVLVCDLVRS